MSGPHAHNGAPPNCVLISVNLSYRVALNAGNVDSARESVIDPQSAVNNVYISVMPARIYIGTHQFTPTERVHITTKGIRIIAPNVKREEEKVILDIQMREVVKIVSCFKSPQSIIFVYVLNACGLYVRESLEMLKTIHDNCE